MVKVTAVKTIANYMPALPFSGVEDMDYFEYSCGHFELMPHDDGNFSATGGMDYEGAQTECSQCPVPGEPSFVKYCSPDMRAEIRQYLSE